VPIDPTALRAQQFRVVFRGYDVEEVDAFLDWIEEELARSAAGPHAAVAGPTAAAHAEAGAPAHAMRSLLHAEQIAERVLAEATAEAAAIRARAEAEAEAILADARAEAEQVAATARLRPSAEVDDLLARGRRLRAEFDRLGDAERHCREELRSWLDEHGRLLDQRPPVWGVPGTRAEVATPPRRDTPTTVRRVVTTLPMSTVR
jgi:DivIVA domain-containing protein